MKLGNLELIPGVPRIAVSLTQATQVDQLQHWIQQGLDIVELRLDLFEPSQEAEINATIASCQEAGLPVILTLRTRAEGGQWQGSRGDYRQLIRQLATSGANAIDIELNCIADQPFDNELIHSLHKLGIATIISYHNVRETPPSSQLQAMVDKAQAFAADIVKIATQVNHPLEAHHLYQLALDNANCAMIIIGMGECGKLTRLSMPSLGSLISFAQVGKPSAAGQIPLAEMAQLFKQWYP